MIFDRRLVLVLSLATGVFPLALGACGDYSNEDLEFMNALPQSSDLRANIPAVSSAVSPADEAELARQTHDVTTNFNGLATSLVSLVDWIRSFPPTTRTPDSRTWGPFRADPKKMKNLDWQTRMIVSRDMTVADRFDYEIDVHKDGNADTDWPTFISGYFQASHTARRGMGHVQLATAAVRAEGLDVSDLGTLDHLEIVYDTFDSPLTINMTVTDLPDPTTNDPAPVLTYAYTANAAGQGQMTFDLYGQLIGGAGTAIEHMNVTSSWLSTGEGRAVLTVVSGDGMGSTQTECWDSSFVATYNSKPWALIEETPTPLPPDPGALCPDIPAL